MGAGSTLLAVAVHDPQEQRRPLRWLQVREIRGELRWWTGLLDPKTAPALEMATV